MARWVGGWVVGAGRLQLHACIAAAATARWVVESNSAWYCSEPLLPSLQVLECWDRKRKDYVAVKIIRNIQVGGSC